MKNNPFLLTPVFKSYIWGGTRLRDVFGKDCAFPQIAESWECSTHPDGESIGTGRRLSEILSEAPYFLGDHPLQMTNGRPELPVLVKLIDAKKDLSIQVHPDDAYAMKHENQLGKTEMWYVLEAAPNAEIIYGFNHDMTEDNLRQTLQSGRILNHLNHVKVKKGDVFLIEAGVVHALGAGCVVAEIQENSNVTYRLYDYDRVDANGRRRQLHLDQGIDVAKLTSSVTPRQPMRVLKYQRGWASELLMSCKYFQVERVLLNTEINKQLVSFQTESNSFHVLLCVDGCGTISGDGFVYNFFKGDTYFVPSSSVPIKLHGKAQFLNISC